MRFGILSGAVPAAAGGAIDAAVAHAQQLESQGFATLSMANIFGLDAIGTLTVVGRETRSIELMTGVVPTYPRHPFAIAQQALTAAAASGGRFSLGIGLSHRIVIEDMLGFSFDKPARHMKEYLEVLGPLLRGEPSKYAGEHFRTNAALDVPDAGPVPLLVAALGPAMLKLTGRLADGTITWMTGPKTLEGHIGPTLRSAAQAAGRGEPRVVAGFPVALCRDADAARRTLDEQLQIYPTLPSYRAMLDREGVTSPSEIAIVGDEAALRGGLRRAQEAGVTDFHASPSDVEPGAAERTIGFLADYARRG